MKRLGVAVIALVALAVFALELDLFRRPFSAPSEPAAARTQPDPEAVARREAQRAQERAMDAKIDAALAVLEKDGIHRSDLVRYFTNEVLDDADMEGLCREREADQGRLDD